MAAPPPPPPPFLRVSSSALGADGTSLLVVTSSTTPVPTNSEPTSTLDTSSTPAATPTSNSSTSHHQPNLNLILTIVFATFGGIVFLALLFGLVIPFIRRRCQKRGRTMGIRPGMSLDDEKRHSIHYWPATTRSPGGVGDEESNDGHDSLLTGTISTIGSRSHVGVVDTDSHRNSHQPHYQLASERHSRIQSVGEENRISRDMEDEEEEEEAVNQGYLGVQPLKHHPGYSSIPPPLANLSAAYALVPNEGPFTTQMDPFVHEQAVVAPPVNIREHDQDVTVSRSKTLKL